MGDISLHNRKTSLYIPRNELHSASKRKISAYLTFAGYLIKDKTSYLNVSVEKTGFSILFVISKKSKRTSFRCVTVSRIISNVVHSPAQLNRLRPVPSQEDWP